MKHRIFFSKMPVDTEYNLEPVKLFHVRYTPKEHNRNLSPIIFLTGLFATNRSFNFVKYEIARRTKREVFVLEFRNHGQSEYSKEFSILHCATDVEYFMQSQNIPRAILAGHSMGGRTMLALALKRPEIVEKVIVEDIPLVSSDSQYKEITNVGFLFKLLKQKSLKFPSELAETEAQKKLMPCLEKFWPKFSKNFSASKYVLPFYKNNKGEFIWELDIDVVTEATNHRDRMELDLTSNPVYSGKVLLMVGEKSYIRVQDNLNDYYKHFPEVECRIIENGIHTFHVEFPQLYIKLVSKFVMADDF